MRGDFRGDADDPVVEVLNGGGDVEPDARGISETGDAGDVIDAADGVDGGAAGIAITLEHVVGFEAQEGFVTHRRVNVVVECAEIFAIVFVGVTSLDMDFCAGCTPGGGVFGILGSAVFVDGQVFVFFVFIVTVFVEAVPDDFCFGWKRGAVEGEPFGLREDGGGVFAGDEVLIGEAYEGDVVGGIFRIVVFMKIDGVDIELGAPGWRLAFVDDEDASVVHVAGQFSGIWVDDAVGGGEDPFGVNEGSCAENVAVAEHGSAAVEGRQGDDGGIPFIDDSVDDGEFGVLERMRGGRQGRSGVVA